MEGGRLHSDWGADCDNNPPCSAMKSPCVSVSMNLNECTYTKQQNYKDGNFCLPSNFI